MILQSKSEKIFLHAPPEFLRSSPVTFCDYVICMNFRLSLLEYSFYFTTTICEKLANTLFAPPTVFLRDLQQLAAVDEHWYTPLLPAIAETTDKSV